MNKANHLPALYDRLLLLVALTLVAIGLLMVTSASMVIAEKLYHNPFHYLIRQSVYLCMGVILALIILRIPVRKWQQHSILLFLVGIFLLLIVLIPGIGRNVNGSTRWIDLLIVRFQVSEFMKLAAIVYLAGYLVRHQATFQKQILSFIRPLILLGVVALLLLLEPDFGAAVVIMSTAMSLLFLAGVRLTYFSVIVAIVGCAVVVLAISSPYRLQRLTTFLNPWAHPFESGYQLTQALIAFGRGGWFGVGLGESVQKLFYLPEAHTDFLFAVLVEELGLIGGLVVIALYVVLVWRGFMIAKRALLQNQQFGAYLAFGLSFWLGIQAFINIGVSAGMLPTKGLTLPLMSAGGSSILINAVVIALLLRIDHETRWQRLGTPTMGYKEP